MTTFTQISRFSNCVFGSYKSFFHGRTSVYSQSCNYTRKSAESKLGIEKPKRPLTPYFKFLAQMRPALLAKNPGITSKEAIVWTTKHWQQLEPETKAKMAKEYEKDREDYKKIKAIYEASLTEEQKTDIKRVREEMAAAKEKRKLKAEWKELGKPKKPSSSYLIFMSTLRPKLEGKNLKEVQEITRKEWFNLSAEEKAKYEQQGQELIKKYKKDMEVWEVKMISMGRSDLVRSTSATKSSQGKSQ